MHIGAAPERQPQLRPTANQPHFRGYPQSRRRFTWHLQGSRYKLTHDPNRAPVRRCIGQALPQGYERLDDDELE